MPQSEIMQKTRQILDRIHHGSGSKTSRTDNTNNASQTLIRSRSKMIFKNTTLQANIRNKRDDGVFVTDQTRSMSQNFIMNTDEEAKPLAIQEYGYLNKTSLLPKVDKERKTLDQMIQELSKANPDGQLPQSTGFVNPQNNPYRKGKIVEDLKKSRSQSTLGLGNQFKNFLPNIAKAKVDDQKDQTKVVTFEQIECKPGMRQDVSYLKEQASTPTKQATILTTGDRNQDRLFEATMGFKNLGKSLINLPQSLDDLQILLKSYPKQSKSTGGIYNLVEMMPDEDEKVLERYLKETFTPLDALLKMQEDGKLDTKHLLTISLPSNQLKQYLKDRESPKREYLKNKNQGNDISMDPHDLKQNDLPKLDIRPIHLSLVSDKLMKKYGERAFLGVDAKFKKTTGLHTSIQNHNDSLFGESTFFKHHHDGRFSNTNLDLGNPSSRQDAIILINWFEKTLRSIVQTKTEDTLPDSNIFALLQLVMNICMQELSRQVTVQCQERGQLLKRVFSTYIKFMELLNTDMNKNRKKLKHDFAIKLDRYVTIYEHQAQGYRDQIIEHEQENRLQKAETEELIKQLKEKANLINQFKKKCYLQSREQDANSSKLRFLEKENTKLKVKLNELKEEYSLDFLDLDETDRQRLILEVEREIQDNDRDKQVNNSKFNQTRTSFGEDFDIMQISDKDVIGMEEKGTTTCNEDYESYLMEIKAQNMRDKNMMTDNGITTEVEISACPQEMGFMIDQETDTNELMGMIEQFSKRIQQLSVIKENDQDSGASSGSEQMEEFDPKDIDDIEGLDLGEDYLQLREMSDRFDKKESQSKNSEAGSKIPASNPQTTHVTNQSQQQKPHQPSPARTTAALIEFLAFSLIKRANLLIEHEKERTETLAEKCPQQIAYSLLANLGETTLEVEKFKKDIEKKKLIVRKSIRQNKKTETNLKKANEKIDSLEMDNYNLREQFQEQIKMLDEYKNIINDIQISVGDQIDKPSEIGILRIKDLVSQLNDMITANQQKTIMDDAENAASINCQIQIQELDDQVNQVQVSSTTPDNKSKAASSNAEVNRKRGVKFQQQSSGKKRSSQAKTKGTHPAYTILKKILVKDPKKLKDVMPRKMLLRVIYQVYLERGLFDISSGPNEGMNSLLVPGMNPKEQFLQTVQSATSHDTKPNSNFLQTSNFQTQQQQQTQANQSQNSLIEWVYDTYMQKYGLKNVAERKFIQLISSCIVYKDQLPRITLFGRFLEAYDDLPPSDYNRYLKLIVLFSQQVLNFKIDENQECNLLPMTRAIDYFRFKFESKHIPHVFQHRVHMIERQKVIISADDGKVFKHLKGVSQAVDFDWFVQFVIDNYQFIQDDKEAQVRDLFQAVDVTSTGFIEYLEFERMMKLFHYKPVSYIVKIFEEYSIQTSDQSLIGGPKLLMLEQFVQMSLEKDFFTPKVQAPIINSKNPDKDFLKLQDNLPSIISLFRARLVTIDHINDQIYLDMLENLQNAVKYTASPRIAWVCYRVIDETFKRLFLKKTAEKFMPIDLSSIQEVRLKPSPMIQSMIPLSYFESQQ